MDRSDDCCFVRLFLLVSGRWHVLIVIRRIRTGDALALMAGEVCLLHSILRVMARLHDTRLVNDDI